MPGAVLDAYICFAQLKPHNHTIEVDAIIILVLQVRKLALMRLSNHLG